MREWRTCLLLLLLLLLLLVLPARAAEAYGEVEISPRVGPVGDNSHGYSEYRFVVRNKGSQPAKVAITLPAFTRPGLKGCITSASREATVGAGATATLSVAYPALPSVVGDGAAVSVNGKAYALPLPVVLASNLGSRGGRGTRMATATKYSLSGLNESLVLQSQSLDEGFFVTGLSESRIQGVAERAPEPISDWSDNWLAYSRYDGVAVTTGDLDKLAGDPRGQAVLLALWRYAETGGVLLAVGPGEPRLPATWKRLPPAQGILAIRQVGFGQCLHCREENPQRWHPVAWDLASSAFKGTGQPWQRPHSIPTLQHSFPAVDDLGVPARGLFVLIVLFAIAIGPVNLWMLGRIKRRIWLFWTVPAISALTCLVVLGYTILGEGWSGHARLGGITLLDQPGDRASTLARSSYYSPLTPGNGLAFPEDTEVQALGDDHPALNSNCVLEWKGEQRLGRGWVAARLPAHFALRRSQAGPKLRLDLHRARDGTLSATNKLGADLRRLTVADEKGDLYTGGPIPAGAEASLRRTAGKAGGDPAKNWRDLYAITDWGMADPAMPLPQEQLVPSSYLAVLEQSPFLEPGLPGAARRPSPSVVIGLYSGLGEP